MTNETASHFQEGQKVFVDLLLVRCAQAVRGALVNLQGRAPDQHGLEQAGVGERHDLVIVYSLIYSFPGLIVCLKMPPRFWLAVSMGIFGEDKVATLDKRGSTSFGFRRC
jgi:hypothetical protein